MKFVPVVQLAGKQFKLVEGNYGAVQIPEITGSMEKQTMVANGGEDIEVKKNGYLYVYVSNASKGNVYFDELSVVHARGPLLEETHYYPFGLTMSGISSKALAFGEPENKKKYNGIEKEGDLQIEIYDAQFRELDGQTGRWWQVDPKTENMEMWSPYASNYDNPILYSDPLGDEGEACCGWLKKAWSGAQEGIKWVNNNINPLVPAAEFITGKSLDSDFTEPKSRTESAVQLATFAVPTAKAETIIANEVKNVVAGQIEKQVVKKIDQEALKRGVKNEGKVLADEGLKKNTTPVTAVDPKTGKSVTTIPDSKMPSGATVEVKDVKKLSDSKQLRAQSAASAQSGQKARVITGTDTKVSTTVEKRMQVERKDYLGPQQ